MFFSYISYVPWVRLGTLLLILLASPSWASAIPQFTLSDNIESQSIATLHWADVSKAATPSEAKAALESGELIVEGFTLPIQDASHWFAVTLTNPTDHTINPSIYLKQAFPHIVNVHFEQRVGLQKTEWVSLFNGTDIPIKQRPIKILAPAFSLFLAPYQEQTYYVEIHSKFKLVRLSVMVGETQNNSYINLVHLTITKIFIGLTLAMLLVNMFLYFSFRDRVYLYYSAYIGTVVLTVTITDALDLFFELPITDRSILSLCYNFLAVFFTLFAGQVLDAKHTMPRFNFILRVVRVVAVITGGLTWYDGNFFHYTLIAFLPLMFLMLGITIYAAVLGQQSARLMARGTTAFVIGLIIAMLTNLSLVPSNLVTLHAVLFGGFVEMLIFSVLLFKRIAVMNEDRHSANLALLELAKETNRTKSAFISTISHELRTPLHTIIGLSEVLASDTSKVSPLKQSEYLGAIHSSGQHLLLLVGDILDLSKLEAGERRLEKQPFTLLEVIEGCHSAFNLTCQNKGINLTIDNQFKGEYPVVGDITALKQMLFNLLDNAIKFTQQGTVRLTAAPHAASQAGPSPGVIFTIIDTGKGIQADAIAHIFDRFTQEDKSITRSHGGCGLGLNIAQNLAQLMGGEITCTSSVGHGSKFEVLVYLEPQSTHVEPVNVNGIEATR